MIYPAKTYSDSRYAFKNHCEYACALERPVPFLRRLRGWIWHS